MLVVGCCCRLARGLAGATADVGRQVGRQKVSLMPVPNIPGGLVVSIVGILNGAINAIAPQVFALLAVLGIGHPV